jgi:hypothetical protein
MMQGFIYTAGVYSKVERRQTQLQTQRLLEGWLRDSVQGMVNGVDGEEGKSSSFIANEEFFNGISLTSLAGSNQGVPHRVEWRLEQSDGYLLLRYGEGPLKGELRWYTLRQWSNAQAGWSYLHRGQWYSSFPEQKALGSNQDYPVLPEAIGLSVSGLQGPFDIIIALRSHTAEYKKPTVEGVF